MSNNRLEQVLQGKEGNTIYPFFWMHGEDHEVLREELDKIYDCNIRGICIEARPHPDFGGGVLVVRYGFYYGICKRA